MPPALKRKREEPTSARRATATLHPTDSHVSVAPRTSPRGSTGLQTQPCATARPYVPEEPIKTLDYRAIANVMDAFEDRLFRGLLDAQPALSRPSSKPSHHMISAPGYSTLPRRPSSTSFSVLDVDVDIDSASSNASFDFSPPPGSPASSLGEEPPLWASALKHDAFLVDPPPLALPQTSRGVGDGQHPRGTSHASCSRSRSIAARETSAMFGHSPADEQAPIGSATYPTDPNASWLVSPNSPASQPTIVWDARLDDCTQRDVSLKHAEAEGYPWLARSSLQLLRSHGQATSSNAMEQMPMSSTMRHSRRSYFPAQSKLGSHPAVSDRGGPSWRPYQSPRDLAMLSPGRDQDNRQSDDNFVTPSALPPFPPLFTLPASGIPSSSSLNSPRLPPMPLSALDTSRRGTTTVRYTLGMMTAQDSMRSYPGEWGEAFR